MLLLIYFGSWGDPNIPRSPGTGYGDLVKTRRFGPFWPVFMLLLTDFGSRGATNVRGTSGTGYGDLVQTRRLGPAWPVFYAITH